MAPGMWNMVSDDDDPSSTTSGGLDRRRTMAQWRLDHILYTPSTLTPLERWATLEDDEHSRTVGLPNDRVPTDHLPIAAAFEICPHPRLPDESRRILIESINEIEGRQTLELKARYDQLDVRRTELERQPAKEEDGIASTDIGTMQSRKMKKKKKGPTPPEMIEHIRGSRAAVRELKARQRVEREEFVGEMSILERMVLRHLLGRNITCAQWIEHGRVK